MLTWMSENSGALNVVLNAAMLGVWGVYLQIMVTSYRRQRRSSILITRGAGHGIRSRCLITNMGAEQVYVTSLLATVTAGDETREYTLTDLRDLPEDLGEDPHSAMRQGSLGTGRYMDLGHFDELLKEITSTDPDFTRNATIDTFVLTVVALYGTERMPVGATRSFAIKKDGDGNRQIVPHSVETRQMRGRRDRKTLRNKLMKHM
ncbi:MULTISPECIES: hypothetical protein [Aurantimonas]|uniref:hypothetical protein n=1 Tax=Aurantimonas TaxID=182269 RepID=UPI00042323D2|nr:hypothetical protein [Aurantimonas coralicida]